MTPTNETLAQSESAVKRGRTKTLRELLAKYQPRKLRHHQRWGDWRLDAHRLTLDFAPGGVWGYELNVECNHNSASILDFIFQVQGKVWATPQVMADLLDAIHDIFRPQANLCGCGQNRRIDSRTFFSTRIEPPTEAECEESARAAFEQNAAWLGTEATEKLLGQ